MTKKRPPRRINPVIAIEYTVIAIIVIAVIMGVLWLLGERGPNKEDSMYGELTSALYSDSGNSLGNLFTVEAFRADDGSMMVRVRESAQHDLPIEVSEYRAPDDLLDQISAVVDRAGMKEWGELPPSRFIAYDASTKSLSLTYDPSDPDEILPVRLSYSFNDELPPGGAEAIREAYRIMVANNSPDSLVRSYTEQVKN